MRNSKKFLLASLLVLSSTAYSKELINKDGYIVDVFGITNVGVSTQTIKIGDYENTKTGVDEDSAWFQLGIKKKLGNMEAGLHLRYGAGFEANTDRTGGDMYIKYHVNDKLALEYAKSDFAYLTLRHYASADSVANAISAYDSSNGNYGAAYGAAMGSGYHIATGKNLGTGTQLELTPEGMVLDPVLSMLEVDYGVVFLGTGLNNVIIGEGGFVPDGGIWSAHMAYANNAINHDLKPGAFNLYYDSDKVSITTSGVYADRDVVNTDASTLKATDTGLTVKGTYSLNKDIKIGGGLTYGNGNTDSSVDSNDVETTIISQNLWANTKLAGFDVFAEVAHSTNEITDTSEKSLTGAYVKASKFIPNIGIPAVEVKIAQSTFDKVDGDTYAKAQENTLVEVKPSLTIPSKKTPMLMYGVNASLGSYKSENIEGTSGNDKNSSQFKLGTSITYIF